MSIPNRANQGAGEGAASFGHHSDGRRASRPFLMVLAAAWAMILVLLAVVMRT